MLLSLSRREIDKKVTKLSLLCVARKVWLGISDSWLKLKDAVFHHFETTIGNILVISKYRKPDLAAIHWRYLPSNMLV